MRAWPCSDKFNAASYGWYCMQKDHRFCYLTNRALERLTYGRFRNKPIVAPGKAVRSNNSLYIHTTACIEIVSASQ